MRITGIEALPVLLESASQPMPFFVVRVETDEGLVGWGESCDSFGVSHPHVLAAIVEESYRPLLLGREFDAAGPLLDEVTRTTRRALGAYSGAAQARSALSIALSDLVGQRAGRSLSDLAGRVRDDIPVYAGLSPFLETLSAAEHADSLAPALDRGVRMVKMRVGVDWRRALRVLRELRDRLPDDIEIAVDGSEFFDLPTTLRMLPALADLGISWFEEPIEHTSVTAVAELAEVSAVPLAYGEHVFGPDFALESLRSARIGVMQPDATIAGGFEAARVVADLAAGARLRVAIHHHAGPISLAANLHVAGSVSSVDVLEYPTHLSPVYDRVAPGSAFDLDEIVDGRLRVPTGPGLGIDVDEAALRRAVLT